MTARNEFDGSIPTILTTTAAIANGNFAVQTTNATIVEYDNTGSSDKWTSLKLVLSGQMAADPGDDKTIDIYRFATEVDGTPGNDEVAPELSEPNQAQYVGRFKVPDGTSAYKAEEIVSVFGIKKCKFSVYVNTTSGASLNSGATITAEGLGMNDS